MRNFSDSLTADTAPSTHRPIYRQVAEETDRFNLGVLGMAFLQIKDYRLTTAEILYHFPDHPALLQTYVWQNMDIAPDYPELRRFLEFWRRNLDGKLHSIRVACAEIMRTGGMRHADHLHLLH